MMVSTKAVLAALSLSLVSGMAQAQPESAASGPERLPAAWQDSAALEARQQFIAAAQLLRPFADRFEQDYPLQLQVAWLLFQGKAYADALPYYQRADALSEEIGLARLGLGWTYYWLGNHEQASARFNEVLAHADSDSAREGIGLIADAKRAGGASKSTKLVWAYASPQLYSYSQHPEKLTAFGVRTGVGFAQSQGLQLSLVFARTLFQGYDLDEMNMGMGPGGRHRSDGSGDFLGTELYLHSAWTARRVALHAHAAVGQEGQDTDLLDYAIGSTIRISLWNDLYVGGSIAHINEAQSRQANLAWDLAVGSKLHLIPGAKVIWTEERDAMPLGTLALGLRLGGVNLWTSGQWGRAYHMVDFALPLLWNHEDDVLWSAAVGANVKLTGRWSLSASAATERYERDAVQSEGSFYATGLRYNMGDTI